MNTDIFVLPDWIEEHRLPDSDLENAYENLPKHCLAALKTGLAVTHFLFSQKQVSCKKQISAKHEGLWQIRTERPADWAMLIFADTYSAAARLCAAAAMPMLADVENVFAVCVGDSPNANVLPGLELCGLENIFCMDELPFSKFMGDFFNARREKASLGRIILLHEGELAMLGDLARKMAIPCYEEFRKPNLFLNNPENFSLELLVFAQGFEPSRTCAGAPDAIYALAPEIAGQWPSAPLVITPGLEGFWLNPGLKPDFFKISQNILGLVSSQEYKLI